MAFNSTKWNESPMKMLRFKEIRVINKLANTKVNLYISGLLYWYSSFPDDITQLKQLVKMHKINVVR